MKSASVADLRNHFPRVAEWIARGEEVRITKRGKTVARLVPPERPPEAPDLAAYFRTTLSDLWGPTVVAEDPVAILRAEDEGRDDALVR